jgi:hypothetical protein
MMAETKDRSLGELEASYKQQLQYWTDQRAEQVKKLAEIDRQLAAYEEKLRWVKTLITSPDGVLPEPPRTGTRRRKSPVKELTYGVLKRRPGQWLTGGEIKTAIRKDTHKRPSRQSINVNLRLLEKTGQIRRRPAPKGSGGAHYVYSAV